MKLSHVANCVHLNYIYICHAISTILAVRLIFLISVLVIDMEEKPDHDNKKKQKSTISRYSTRKPR